MHTVTKFNWQKMKPIYTIIVLFLIFGVFGCKEDQQSTDTDTTVGSVSTFYFVRHAEKDRTDPENVDPELTQAGLGRAMHWAEILNDVAIDAIYSTDYMRTSMTAAPTSVKKDLTVQYYDPQTLDIEQFKTDNLNKNVLVVGHSNTTPDLVNQVIGEDKYNAMDDTDNGSLFIVQLVGNQATATRLLFNCNCPAGRE